MYAVDGATVEPEWHYTIDTIAFLVATVFITALLVLRGEVLDRGELPSQFFAAVYRDVLRCSSQLCWWMG